MDIGILGCGVMGSAFALHFAKKHTLYLHDKNLDKSSLLAKELSAHALSTNKEIGEKVDILFLAVKPHHLHDVAEEIEAYIKEETIIVSMIVGLSLEELQEHFSKGKMMRIMPNLSISSGKGVIAVAEPMPLDKTEVEVLFDGLGVITFVPESQMAAIGALAGSGPAYIFLMLEALVEGGIAMGISAKESLELSMQTMEGAVALLREKGCVPEKAKWEITSPGGTTIEALLEMDRAGVKAGIIDGMLAAYNKSHVI